MNAGMQNYRPGMNPAYDRLRAEAIRAESEEAQKARLLRDAPLMRNANCDAQALSAGETARAAQRAAIISLSFSAIEQAKRARLRNTVFSVLGQAALAITILLILAAILG